MNASELQRGDHAVVMKIELPMLLKERLRSLGIYTGSKFAVLKVLSKKNVFLVQAGGAKVALDGELMDGVKVWRI